MNFSDKELLNIKNSLKHWNISQGQRSCVLSLIEQSKIDNRILKEINHFKKLQRLGVKSERITHCLEMLRYIRNSELDLKSEEGVEQENQ